MKLPKQVVVLLCCTFLYTQLLQSQDLNKMIISIELKNATLTEALSKIENQTVLKFNYKTGDLAGITGITYKQQQAPVKKVLSDLLNNTPLLYEQVQHYILIRKKPVTRTSKKGKVTVTGLIKDAGTGEPLPYVNIGIMDQPGGAISNAEGYFTLHGIPSDSSVLVLTAIGHQQVQYPVTPASWNEMITIEMETESRHLNQVTIEHAKKAAFRMNSRPGVIRLSPANVAILPRVGDKDIFRSLQLMPGISAGNEQSAGLYVRGGTPDQNLVLFDGFTVYNVDHLFGFFSTFNTNAVKDVQVYKSGFDAKYGGRLSALVDIAGKEGNNNEFNAGIDLSAMSAGGFIEAPIGKKITTLFAYRRSFKTPMYNKLFDQAKTGKSGERDQNDISIMTTRPLSYFDDLNAKFTIRPTEKDALSVSFYKAKDYLDNSYTAGDSTFKTIVADLFEWGNTGASIKWTRKWSTNFFTNTQLSYSDYFSDRRFTQELVIDSRKLLRGFDEHNKLKDYSLKSGFEWMPGPVHAIEGGIQITRNGIAYRYVQNDTTTILNRNTKGTTSSIYLQDQLHLLNNKLQVTPGIRISLFDVTHGFYYEPRLTATYELNTNTKLKGAAGQYYQFAKRVLREDVLNGSRDFWTLSDGNRLPVSSSQQYMLGFSREDNNYLVDVEAWYKKMNGLSEYTLRYQANLQGTPYEELFYQGKGYAHGLDILLQKRMGKYTGWITYTLAEVKHKFPVYQNGYFYAANDVRHEFKTVHTFHNKRWDFTVAWLYLTGRPYTAITGAYQLVLLGGSWQNYLITSAKNAVRLPDYHRLDLAINYNYGKPGKLNGLIGLSVFNVYNWKNSWYKNYEVLGASFTVGLLETDVKYLAIMPNLSITCNLR